MIARTRPPAEEIGRLVDTLYESKLRSQIEPGNFGKYLVIDVETGDYELDADLESASDRAWSRRPDGWWYAMRIGYPVIGHFGSHTLRVVQ